MDSKNLYCVVLDCETISGDIIKKSLYIVAESMLEAIRKSYTYSSRALALKVELIAESDTLML